MSPRAEIPTWILTAPVSDRAVRVYGVLRMHADEQPDGDPPSYVEIANCLHIAKPDPIGLAVKELVAVGAITHAIVRTDTGRRSRYVFLPQPDVSDDVDAPAEYLPHRWEARRGDWPPVDRGPVVYWLYDADDVLAYVGSTGHFRGRLPGHEGKPWVRYEARLCTSRRAAYVLEALEIDEKRPYLNRRIPGAVSA